MNTDIRSGNFRNCRHQDIHFHRTILRHLGYNHNCPRDNQMNMPSHNTIHMILNHMKNIRYTNYCHWCRRRPQYIYHYMFGCMVGLLPWHVPWMLFHPDMLMNLLCPCQMLCRWYYLPLNMIYNCRHCLNNNLNHMIPPCTSYNHLGNIFRSHLWNYQRHWWCNSCSNM